MPGEQRTAMMPAPANVDAPDDPEDPDDASQFFPAWRVVAVAAVLVLVAFGAGWAALARSGEGVAVPAADGGFRSTQDTGSRDRLPPSQPASPVSFGPDGQVVRPAPALARVVDPSSGAEVLVPLPPGTTVDTRTGRIVPVDPTTTDPSANTTTTVSHHSGGGTTTTVDTTPATTEAPTTTTEAPTTTVTDPTTTDTTDPSTTDTTVATP